MKTKLYLGIVLASLLSLNTSCAQSKSEKFKVMGSCGMCENRIESAAKSVEGVLSADWNKESNMIEVSFDESKTDIHKIHLAIANAGHDTDMHKAKDDVYEGLPGCCKYRSADDHSDHNH